MIEAPRLYKNIDQERHTVVEDEIRNFGRTIVVVSHPDDDTFLLGGTISLAGQNNEVIIVTATKGEMGAEKHGWQRDETAKVRESEQIAALEMLGIAPENQHWLGYTDNELLQTDRQEAVTKIEKYLRYFKPKTIITFGNDGVTGHPDHKTVHEWTTEAVSQFADSESQFFHIGLPPEWIYGDQRILLDEMGFYYPGYPHIQPRNEKELAVSLSSDTLNTKLKAVTMHESQYGHVLPNFPDHMIKNILGKERLIQVHPQHNQSTL